MENQSKSVQNSQQHENSTASEKVKPKILIVDDETTLGEMLQDILEVYDYETAFAETSDAAIHLASEFKPWVALVDFRLGDVTGIEVAQSLKKIDEDLPVILMTAYPSLDLAVKAIQSDIYDFISKPIDKTYLLRSITKAIEKRNLSEENKKLIASLKESNASLERLNRMKSKFLSIVTHDLRTPLTSIKGYTEILQVSEGLTDEIKTKCFSAIQTSAERMGTLINSLMDMVSIESGKLRVEKSSMDFISICKELQQTLATVADSKKISLEWEFPQQPIMVMGDSIRLIQVLTNLISNGFKHVTENGLIRVKVSVRQSAGANMSNNRDVVISEVIDNGEGIAPENQTKIFEQFYQIETSPTRREGIGLGLNISKEIVLAHEGEIGVKSEGLGKGSTFWFTIPILK